MRAKPTKVGRLVNALCDRAVPGVEAGLGAVRGYPRPPQPGQVHHGAALQAGQVLPSPAWACLQPGSELRWQDWTAVLCNTMKAGTTTWARLFLQLYLPHALNWKRQSTKFSPFNVGYQVKLQQLQAKRFTAEEKAGVVKSLEQKEHEYFAFFVCRDPIERLKSLYLYSLDLKRFKPGKTPRNFQEFLTVSFSNISSILSESTLLRPTVGKQAKKIDGF